MEKKFLKCLVTWPVINLPEFSESKRIQNKIKFDVIDQKNLPFYIYKFIKRKIPSKNTNIQPHEVKAMILRKWLHVWNYALTNIALV